MAWSWRGRESLRYAPLVSGQAWGSCDHTFSQLHFFPPLSAHPWIISTRLETPYIIFLCHRWHERITICEERLPIGLLWTSPPQHNSASSFRWLYKTTCVRLCPPLFLLGYTSFTRSFHTALNIFLRNLQKVQNSAARLVQKAHKQDHVSTLLRTLHWLLIQACIKCKLSTLCHSFLFDTAPVYLSDLLRVYCTSRQLRFSSDSGTLRIPHINLLQL